MQEKISHKPKFVTETYNLIIQTITNLQSTDDQRSDKAQQLTKTYH